MDALTTEQIEENNELLKKLQTTIAALVRTSNEVPVMGNGFEVLATFPEFAQFMDHQRTRIIRVLRMLLDAAGLRSIRIDQHRLEDMGQLINVNDRLVEHIALAFDEHQSALTRDRIKARKIQLGAEPVQQQSTIKMLATLSTSEAAAFKQPYRDGGGRYALLSRTTTECVSKTTYQSYCTTAGASTVKQKPQQLYRFQHCIVNADQPFAHKLRVKHNALERASGIMMKKTGNLKLISDSISMEAVSSCSSKTNYGDAHGRWDWLNDEQGIEEDSELQNHPYQYELENYAPTEEQLAVPQKIQYPTISLEDTPFSMVTQLDELKALINDLNNVGEFAFDLEHHNMRSFLGITCLLQISTRHKDYVVDPFPLWEQMYLLNEPFTNPNIVKVAFYAYGDTSWLQRDFGIYVVGLFDASIAFCTITADQPTLKGSKSLRALVSKVVRVTLSKDNQKADWRIRPLTDKMVEYARLDTHYLLACYDYLKRQLAIWTMEREGKSTAVRNAIADIYEQSRKICSIQFPQPRFDQNGYSQLVHGHRLNNRQIFALKELWRWRDQVAREYDESVYYVLPHQIMLKIAETLPRESSGILACCTPPITSLIRHELENMFRIICIARELPLEQMAQANALSQLLHQQNADDILGDPSLQNRVVGVKAKLEFRFDCCKLSKSEEQQQQQLSKQQVLNGVHENADTIFGEDKIEEEPVIKRRCRRVVVEQNELLAEEDGDDRPQQTSEDQASKQQNVQINGVNNAADVQTSIVVGIEEAAKQRAQEIHTRIEEQWASPYDSYLVALREAEQKCKGNVKPDKMLLTETGTTGKKKRYSHLDDDEDECEELQN